MSEDERTDEQNQQGEDVEAHGVKEVAGVGLAAAALIGAGAVGVKVATDDDKPRNRAALVAEGDAREQLAKADADADGYVNYRELSLIGWKWTADQLKAEGLEVTPESLASAGNKIDITLIGKEDGFPVEDNLIILKRGISPELDKLAEGPALEWHEKHTEMDRDGDGYAAPLELEQAGYKFVVPLDEASYKEYEAKELELAGVKFELATLGEGGFPVEDNLVIYKEAIDEKLDAFIKGEDRG